MYLADILQPGIQEVTVFVTTIMVCMIILNLKSFFLNRRAGDDILQAHSTHTTATPRLGGVAILGAVLITTLFEVGYFGGRYLQFVAATLPMLMVSVWEDVYRPTSPKIRLLATVVSCLLAIAYLGVWLTRINLSFLDPWMPGAAGILITVVFVVGTVNGFNMIDGLNGLCAGVALAAFIALYALASAVGFDFIAQITLALSAAVLGFLIFNFPSGKIFLGDTGSYLLGYLVAWFGLSICYRFPVVSPWSIFLILGYPIGDVAITMFRRLLAGVSPLKPDTKHLHHLVLSLCRRHWPSDMPKKWQNPLTTLIVLPLAVIPMVVGVVFHETPRILQVSAAIYAAVFIGLYVSLAAINKRSELGKASSS